ncbi:MAG: rRNA adenine dimethyltransferase family protein [bacterium]
MKAKKSLGQNFLKSEPALRKIVETGEIKPTDVILEIGPGKGALTKKLLEQIYPHPASPYVGGGALSSSKGGGGMVIAVEKDRELFELLKIKFEKEILSGQLKLLNEDILQFQITNYELRIYKIIANIPYNITGAILKKFLTTENQPEMMVLMVQNEVAKRIVARDGKESILSISVKAYGEPKLIMKVPARYFSPAPKVDSAVIAIKNISRKLFTDNKIFEEKFWEIVKTGFAHKRKKLSGNLKGLVFLEKDELQNFADKRAENLTLKDWIALTGDAIINS